MADLEQRVLPQVPMPAESPTLLIVGPSEAGQRLDHFLAAAFNDQSRSTLNKLISTNHVLVDGQRVKASRRLRVQETVSIIFPPLAPQGLIPEQVEFAVLYEDESLMVINKPAGLVVHPASGHTSGTLAHGLLYLCSELPAAAAGRPGIVHRLDKDTSGVLLVAKTEQALRTLMADFKNRSIRKVYHALLIRCPQENEGRVVAPIGRHPVDRKKMAVQEEQGRFAATNWRILERFVNGWCLVEIDIETGRTHQIRVHMASIKAPVVADPLYGGAVHRSSAVRPMRQMLHASTLRFRHPLSGEELCCTAPWCEDMQTIVNVLRGAVA